MIYSPAKVAFEKEVLKGVGTNQPHKYQGEAQTQSVLENFFIPNATSDNLNETDNQFRQRPASHSQVLEFKYNKGIPRTKEQDELKKLKKQKETQEILRQAEDSSSDVVLKKGHLILSIQDLLRLTEDLTKAHKIQKKRQKSQINKNDFTQDSIEFPDDLSEMSARKSEKIWDPQENNDISISSRTPTKSRVKKKNEELGRSLTPRKESGKKGIVYNPISPNNNIELNDTLSQNHLDHYMNPLGLKYQEQIKNYKQNSIEGTPRTPKKKIEENLNKSRSKVLQSNDLRTPAEPDDLSELSRENTIQNQFSKGTPISTHSRNKSSNMKVKKQVEVISPKSPLNVQKTKETSNPEMIKSIFKMSEKASTAVAIDAELSPRREKLNKQKSKSPVPELNMSMLDTPNYNNYRKAIQKNKELKQQKRESEYQEPKIQEAIIDHNISIEEYNVKASKNESKREKDKRYQENEYNNQVQKDKSQDGMVGNSKISGQLSNTPEKKITNKQLDSSKNGNVKRNNDINIIKYNELSKKNSIATSVIQEEMTHSYHHPYNNAELRQGELCDRNMLDRIYNEKISNSFSFSADGKPLKFKSNIIF